MVRSEQSPESLAWEFEPTAAAIRKWVKQADLDEGHGNDGLTRFDRQKLGLARREIKEWRIGRLLSLRRWVRPLNDASTYPRSQPTTRRLSPLLWVSVLHEKMGR